MKNVQEVLIINIYYTTSEIASRLSKSDKIIYQSIKRLKGDESVMIMMDTGK